MSNDKVVVITVTYNTFKTLQLTIHALLEQTISPYKIIIVDNNSTEAIKKEIAQFIENKTDIDVLWLRENSGGAGGFYQGMKYAQKEYHPDWYWLMDDDAYPEQDCLERLLAYKDYSNNIGFLAPLIYGVDWKEYQFYHHKRINKVFFNAHRVVSQLETMPDVIHIDANAFVGPLFAQRAVNKLGVVDGELFIYGDDVEYTYRVSREFDAWLIKSAIINHKDIPLKGKGRSYLTWWKDYYLIRNSFLFANKYCVNIYNKFTSYTYIFWRIIKLFGANIIDKENRVFWKVRWNLMKQAIADGMHNRKGKQIDPACYMKQFER